MTQPTPPVTVLKPVAARYSRDLPKLRDWRPGLIRAALKARWGDRFDTEVLMLITLTGYDPISLLPCRVENTDNGPVLHYDYTGDPVVAGAVILDDNVRAAHVTADLILQVAGELAADQIDLAIQQYALNYSTTPVVRRDQAVSWFTRKAATLRNESRRIAEPPKETHNHAAH